MIDKEIKKIENDIKKLEKPVLSDFSKMRIKNNLFCKTESFSVAKFSLDVVERARIKEKVMNLLVSHPQRTRFSLFGSFFGWKMESLRKFAVVCLVFVFSISMFGFLNSGPDVVRAATPAVLRGYTGDVSVRRGDGFIDIYEGMYLDEGDIIYTEDGAQAVIEYFEDSVTRLSGGTEVVLNKLGEGESSLDNGVEVFVVQGIVWSKILNLEDSDQFFSVGAGEINASARRGTFNVKVDGEKVEIGVFKNSVDVKDDKSSERLVSGEKIIFDRVEDQRMVSLLEEGEDDDWIKENLEHDKRYLSEVEERLLLARAEAVGVDMDDKIVYDEFLQSNSFLFFTFDDVEERKFQLEEAEQSLIDSKLKFIQGDLDEDGVLEMESLEYEFEEELRSFNDFVDKIAYTDEKYANELKSYVVEREEMVKNSLSLEDSDEDVVSVAVKSDEIIEEIVDEDFEDIFLEEVSVVSKDMIIDAPYGVKVRDGKPLNPILGAGLSQ